MESLVTVTLLFQSGETAQPPMTQADAEKVKEAFLKKERVIVQGIYAIDGSRIEMIYISE